VGRLLGTGLRPGFLEKFHKRGVKLPAWLSSPDSNSHASEMARPEGLV